jgi:phage baseplate assembly protein V
MIRDLMRMLGFGRVTKTDDAGELQYLQITQGALGTGFKDRVMDKVPRVSEFGFISVPPLESEVVLLHRGGDRSQSLVIGTSHRPSRLRNLKPGDSGIHDVRGAKVLLTENGLEADCKGKPARIVATDLVLVVGGVEISLKAIHDAYNAHKHPVSGPITGLTDHLLS